MVTVRLSLSTTMPADVLSSAETAIAQNARPSAATRSTMRCPSMTGPPFTRAPARLDRVPRRGGSFLGLLREVLVKPVGYLGQRRFNGSTAVIAAVFHD